MAGPDLISYPMFATLDDRGRLFVSESTGPNTMTTREMLANPANQVRVLEDVDGDGVYDRSHIFADRIPLPQGGTFYRGALYVAAPLDLLRLEDSDGDGIADRRDRTGLEVVAAGGFDNAVELIFTGAGETIGTMTYFIDPQAGQRDALIHWVEGGVYPKPHRVIEDDALQRTGDLMPVMTRFARVAPAGLMRYRGTSLGTEYQGNLFSAQFNTHRVLRHVVVRDGATFRTREEEFLTSTDPHFHPTDVLEDADGSLLLLDTGGWFTKGCPLSRVTKLGFRGGIYRIRRLGSHPTADPRGEDIAFGSLSPAELTGYLGDSRPSVQDRAVEELVQRGSAAVGELSRLLREHPSQGVRSSTVFALSRIHSSEALAALHPALEDSDIGVRVAAARVLGMARDVESLDRLLELVNNDLPAVRRQAATAIGQIGSSSAVPALLEAASDPDDRFVEHAIIDALIKLADPVPLIEALDHSSPAVRKAALIGLDQMKGRPLKRTHLLSLLQTDDPGLQEAALWVASHRLEWSGAIRKHLEKQMRGTAVSGSVEKALDAVLLAFCATPEIQAMLGELMLEASVGRERNVLFLKTMEACPVTEFPSVWADPVRGVLAGGNSGARSGAVALIRAHELDLYDEELISIIDRTSEPVELRLAAVDALARHRSRLRQSHFELLLDQLEPEVGASLRQLAAAILGGSELSRDQLIRLAKDHLPRGDPLLLPSLLRAYRGGSDPEVGAALVAALIESSSVLDSFHDSRLEDLLSTYSEAVQASARPLIAELARLRESRLQRLGKLLGELGAGDVERGARIFFGRKAACSTCHTIGFEGGSVGPDLTSIGAIRSRHDIAESILFPSARLVREFGSFRVETSREIYEGIPRGGTNQVLILITGADYQVRIPRTESVSMDPSPVSMMPEGLHESLTVTEMSDLMVYLVAQKMRPAD